MILTLLLSFIGCTPTAVYCYPEDTATAEQDTIPTPSQDRENKEPSSEPSSDTTNSTDTTEPSEEPIEPESVTVEYALDDTESLLYVQVFKDESALGSGFAHNHVMRASNWDGIISYNADDLSTCYFDFIVPVADLKVDEDAMRSYVGYGDTLSTSDRNTIREHMLASDQLDGNNHPFITFVSTQCSFDSQNTLRVTGEMTLVGTTKTIDLLMDFVIDGDRLYSEGRFDFSHSDFDMTPYSGFWGAVRNAEELEIHWDMIGYAQ